MTAKQVINHLLESNYETSGDEFVAECSTSASSDSVFDLSDPEAGMERFGYGDTNSYERMEEFSHEDIVYEGIEGFSHSDTECVSSTDTGEDNMEDSSDGKITCDCVSSTDTNRSRIYRRNKVRHVSSDLSSSSEEYWKTLFFHFIDLSVNAYILYKTIHPGDKTGHYQFRELLVRALCQIPFDYDPTFTSPGSSGRPVRDMTVTHYLTQSKGMHERVYCKVVNKKRSRTSRICAACELPFCFSSNSNCFVKYHHRSFIDQRFLIEKNTNTREL